jgi:hypothetical protein
MSKKALTPYEQHMRNVDRIIVELDKVLKGESNVLDRKKK